jgi:low temperature requirement protein LtrA
MQGALLPWARVRDAVGMMPEVLRPRGPGRATPVTNTELFFDLVYVFAITRLSSRLAEHLSGPGVLETVILLGAVWWAWNYTAWATNWIDPNRRVVQALLLVLMFASLVMAAAIPQAFGPRGLEFAAAYVGLQLLRSAFMVVAFGRGDRMRRNFAQLLAWSAIAGAAWIAGAFLPLPARLGLWIVAVLIEYLAPAHGFALPGAGRTPMSDWSLAGEHLSERMQAFVIIALGESVVAVGSSFSTAGHTAMAWGGFLIGFLANVSLFAIYFVRGGEQASEQIASAADPAKAGRGGYAYAHLVMVAGIIALAVAIEHTSTHPLGHLSAATAAVILASPAIYLAGNAWFHATVTGGLPSARLAGAGVLALLIPVALVASPLVLLALATLVVLILALAGGAPYRPRFGPGTTQPETRRTDGSPNLPAGNDQRSTSN